MSGYPDSDGEETTSEPESWKSILSVAVSGLPSDGSDRPGTPGSPGSSRSAKTAGANKPRCERHRDRSAKLYCHTCDAAICYACAHMWHPTTGHECWDIAEAVDHCRSVLATHAAKLSGRCRDCISHIKDSNSRIDSIRSASQHFLNIY